MTFRAEPRHTWTSSSWMSLMATTSYPLSSPRLVRRNLPKIILDQPVQEVLIHDLCACSPGTSLSLMQTWCCADVAFVLISSSLQTAHLCEAWLTRCTRSTARSW